MLAPKFTGLNFQWRFIVNTYKRISGKKMETPYYVYEPMIAQNITNISKLGQNFMCFTMCNMYITWSLLRNLREEIRGYYIVPRK